MPDLLAVVNLERTTGAAEDRVSNGFAFSMPSGVGATEYAAIAQAVSDFYNVAAPTASSALAAWMSEELSRVASVGTTKIYDITGHLDGSPHGPPIHSVTFTLGGAGVGTPMPGECAVACTLRGTAWQEQSIEIPDESDPGIARDRPRARHTGKLYLGPWQTTAIQEVASPTLSRVNPTLVDDVLKAAHELADDARAIAAGGRWCIWSRADQFLYTVTHVQVDTEWDTQRRRGVRSTVRTTRDVTVAI